MRLHVNLIPALAYALVMLFSNMAGITGEAGKTPKEKQVVSLPVTSQELNRPNSYVLVTKFGQVILSNRTGKGDLEWMIPYRTSFCGFAIRINGDAKPI